ncbi:uncharacterized protein LOC113683492 isoform X2 [Pocillopora damicornis]|uniref:uncharacterized protein LOC113683492 isoform X2 n=1 Tax=Pocillopora damicornis TaxID=46731 RepID=UPI000F550AE7|nr:uncharacterized protein LOC113683492 isoform X2 [Pocillopora damicornis]
MSFFLLKMSDGSSTNCPSNCNDHGLCVRGSCICEVKYSGGACDDANIGYFIGFSVVFFFVSAVSATQLFLCVRSEFKKLKRPSIAKACRLTVQKTLYICMIIACGSRGVYYSVQTFHVVGLRLDKPRFLSKSSLAFIAFNVFLFLVFLAQFITIEITDEQGKVYLSNIFTGIFVVLMFLMLMLFLIYGVELYYKVRGAFITTEPSNVDITQAAMSRFGLFSQASLQLLTSLFLLGDIMGAKWKHKLPMEGRNALEVVFRVFELGVALWFSCCLWNWKSPSQLWILNPKRLLVHETDEETSHLLGQSHHCHSYEAIETDADIDAPHRDCWICYDSDRTDAGPMILPCNCKGDVAAVHHDCLKRWLLESCPESRLDGPKCKVCREEYKLETGRKWLPSGLTVRHWIQTTLILSMMIGTPISVYFLCLTKMSETCKVVVIGMGVVLEYVCLRLLGFNMLLVYRRARLATMSIIGDPVTGSQLPGEIHTTPEAVDITTA